ncbi:Intracellular phospholipase A1 [Caenorhabditis elegans]|uniref:Isoform c of Intracellular phospholipase A1 n=1 Tax=Caenorhabditis elegans TaxID=6239 RepID=G5EEM9-2|nr:Intracellular phospholipase A1 [Caenorhabditis elegans]CCD70557.1 Intracellular phospholipase A1 [Caenorhabditis elegans]|eukprot:NP_001040793.1 Intracelllar PhosphoLipase A family [Caenorhabditis elegans]
MVLGKKKVSRATKSDDTQPDPNGKYTMAQTKDADLSRPSGLPSNGNPGSSTTVPPASKSGPVAPPRPSGTPVAPQRNRRRKVTELKCSEVRWFFQEPKGTLWNPFNGRDSIMLEIKYRKEKGIELDEAMQEIYDESLTHYKMEMKDEPEIENGNIGMEQEKPMVVVMNGQYKVNKDNSKIDPIYWKDDSKEIRRGSWFSPDYQPLEMPLSDQIEKNHLQCFRNQMIPEGTTVFSKSETSNKPVLAELHVDGYDIRWSSVIDISLHQKGNAILRYLWAKSTPLRRGYEKEADWNDAAAEISHLILVVHGIGQKGYENLIAQNANQVRDGVVSAMEKVYPEEKSRPMFLPVEWRSALKLDNGLTDNITIPKMSSMRASLNSTAMDVMYYQSPLFRTEIVRGVVSQLNRTYKLFKANNPQFNGHVSVFGHSLGSVICYDVLTQYSPLMLFDKYVTKSIDEYLKRDDTNASEEARKALEAMKLAREQLRDNLEGGIHKLLVTKEEQLEFKVKYLFAVGSPLGVFLTMRGGESTDLLSKATNVERVFNIFHPYDPVAYRLEPFFAPEYRHIRPIKLFSNTDLRARASYENLPLDVYKHYLKKLKNLNKAKKNKDDKTADARSGGDDENEDEDECDSDEDARSGCSSPRSMTPPPFETAAANAAAAAKETKAVKKGWFSFGTSSNPKKTQSTASLGSVNATSTENIEFAKEAAEELPLAEKILGSGVRVPHRIDFQLQPALTEKSYWSVLKSHFAYWTNADLALFLANVLYCKPLKPEEAKPTWA